MLQYVTDIKFKVSQFKYSQSKDFEGELILLFNDFINYSLINRPFLDDSILTKIKLIRESNQAAFEKISYYINVKEHVGSKKRAELLADLLTSTNLINYKEYITLEDDIVLQMRKDLNVIKQI